MKLSIAHHSLIEDTRLSIAIKSLNVKCYRETERDGNCFYASVALLLHPIIQENPEFRKKFFSFNEDFKKAGISSAVHETYTESIVEFIIQKETDNLEKEDLYILIGYLRIISAAQMILNECKYKDFIDSDFRSYVDRNIMAMGARSGHVEIISLTDCLPIKIVVHDITSGKEYVNEFGEGLEINILHSPDHFEPVYY